LAIGFDYVSDSEWIASFRRLYLPNVVNHDSRFFGLVVVLGDRKGAVTFRKGYKSYLIL
jgi:hypothetical protein